MLAGDKENVPNVLIFSPPRAMKREEMLKVSTYARYTLKNNTGSTKKSNFAKKLWFKRYLTVLSLFYLNNLL